MALTYLAALVLVAASRSIMTAGAFLVQRRNGNSGWVDTIWTFSLGLVGAGSALWPIESPPNARRDPLSRLSVAYESILFFPLPPQA